MGREKEGRKGERRQEWRLKPYDLQLSNQKQEEDPAPCVWLIHILLPALELEQKGRPMESQTGISAWEWTPPTLFLDLAKPVSSLSAFLALTLTLENLRLEQNWGIGHLPNPI